MSNTSLVVVIPAYAQGSSILPTLNSIEKSARAFTSLPYTIIVSDSSPSNQICEEATSWAKSAGCELVLDHSPERRLSYEALNVAFSKPEIAAADIVIITNDDVVLDTNCVSNIVKALRDNPDAVAATGCCRPDPRHSTKKYRASAWQMKVLEQMALIFPPNSVRIEGAIWAARGSFVNTFRFPRERTVLADDVFVGDYLAHNDLKTLNVPDSVVYKIPAFGITDFAHQTQRGQKALAESPWPPLTHFTRFRAIAIAALVDPLGFWFYAWYRLVIVCNPRFSKKRIEANWERSLSTLRK